jgi:catechol 2,3-dioxygenase-like lactoylglutathione lyase family enzyme
MPSQEQQRAKSEVTFRSNTDVAIHVPDLKKAESFYAGVLGFHLISRTDAQLHFDTGSFHLWVNKDNLPLPFVPSFDVPDYELAERHLLAAGSKKADGHGTYFEDPFGFRFDIIAS